MKLSTVLEALKTARATLHARTEAALRRLVTLGAVMPGDEEHEAWTIPEPGRVIPVDFARAAGRKRATA